MLTLSPVSALPMLHSLSFFQQQAIDSENKKLFWILFLIAFAFIVIAISVLVLVVAILKTRTKIMGIVTDLHGKSLPIIATSTRLLEDLSPKVQEITANVQHISAVARNKVEEFEPTISAANRTVKDANAKTHEQIVRVNEMITSVLNTTSEIAGKVDAGIKVPFREASGIWAGIKAGVDTLITGRRPSPFRHSTEAHSASSYAPETPASTAAAAARAAFSRAEVRDSDL